MKPEDVPDAVTRAFVEAYSRADGEWVVDGERTLAALAAVIPLIEAWEREACAEVADAEASVEGIAQRIAAAIRALPLTGDGGRDGR